MGVRFDAVAERLRTARARDDADRLAPRARDRQHPRMRSPGESRIACLGAVALALSSASETAHAQQWQQLSGWSDQFAAGAFDARRNRFVDCGTFDVVREWTGVAWNASESTAPAALVGGVDYSTAFDSRRGRIYVFGDLRAGGLRDCWFYDGIAWAQTPPFAATPRRRPAMTYDAARDRLVVYGGENPLGLVNPFDTWEFDGQQWLAGPPGPQWTHGAAVVFDVARSDVLLLDDATYRLTASSWQQIAPDATTPRSRLCYDPLRQRVVHWRADGTPALREWDGTSWTTMLLTGVPAAFTPAMWFDAAAGRTMLLGDLGRGPWSWDGAVLRSHASRLVAGGACWGSGPPSGHCVAFGGWSVDHALDETWTWDGRRWSQLHPTTRPPARVEASATYDPLGNRMLMFGGRSATAFLGDLWSFDGTNWTQLASSGPPPSYADAFTFDWLRQRAVLIEGLGSGLASTTWEWNGINWIAAPNTFPASRWARLCYDPFRARTIAYDGNLGLTCEWDGVRWTTVATPLRPPTSRDVAMTYDLARRRVALVGSAPGFGHWEYDGTTWTQRTGAGTYQLYSGLAAADFVLTCSFATGRLSLFDGNRVQEVMSTPPVSDSYGTPCGDTPTVLMVRAPLQVGESAFALDLAVAPGEPVLFGLSASQANVPLGGGCTVWVGALVDTALGLADARGLASWLLPVPADPALRGLAAFAQGGALTATGAIRLSQGMHLVVGG